MLKTKPQPGTKIRCTDNKGFSFLTEGKVYDVIEYDGEEDCCYIIDDQGDVVEHVLYCDDSEQFELVQEEKEQMTTTEQTPDEFKVGDVVYDVVKGKGKVTEINNGNTYPVFVIFSEDDCSTYTQDGRQWLEHNRTLFFSEPKIEASVKRPFTPMLVGKTVVVREPACYDIVITITCEDEYSFGNEEYTFCKKNVEVFELGSKLI